MNILKDILIEYKLYITGRIRMLTRPPKEWSRGDKGNVILIPGFADNHYYLTYIGNELNHLGFKIHVLSNFNTTRYTIDRLAARLAKYIKTNDLDDVILIGHSKGGLVAKYAADHYPSIDEHIRYIFTIATPYRGVYWGKFKWIPYAWEFNPLNPVLEQINKETEISSRLINIYSRIDNVIIPNSSLYYEYARANIKVNFIGHTGILNNPEVVLQITSHLDQKGA